MSGDFSISLLDVEIKLAKDPNNEELLSLKEDILQLMQEQNEDMIDIPIPSNNNDPPHQQQDPTSTTTTSSSINTKEIDDNYKKKKKKKNKNKESRLNIREQFGESEKQSWQSFAKQKGLKGICKKSIFASPITTKGKVGVGTNGIADAPSASTTINPASSSSTFQQVAKSKKY